VYKTLLTFVDKKLHIDMNYFIRGGFWLSVGQVVAILGGLLTTTLFAHYLSETEYGIYRYLIGLSVILSAFSLTGLGQSIIQTAAKGYRGFYKETLRVNFLYSLGITAIALSTASYYWLNNKTVLAYSCLAIALIQPISTIFQHIPSVLQGSRQFKKGTLVQTVRTIIITIVSVGTLWITKNILVLFVVYLLSYAITNIATYWWFRHTDSLTPAPIYKKFLDYARHTSARNIILTIAQRADTLIIFTQLGASELALYTIATIIPEQIKASFKNVAALLIPKYASHTSPEIIKNSLGKRSLQFFFILTVITICYILIAPLLYALLFPKYGDAVFYSQLTALAFPTFIMLLPYSFLQAQLDEKKLYSVTVIGAIIQISLLVALTHSFGLLGAIVAKLLFRAIFSILVFWKVTKS
jgi:O-antigen/teichoic acid export membrane protein